jgi:hypothetical protein
MPPSMTALAPPPAPEDTFDRDFGRQLQVAGHANAQNLQDESRFNAREDQLHSQGRTEGLEDENRMWQRISPYLDMVAKPIDMSSFSSGSSAGLPGSPAAAASDMAFARAKDKAGLLAAARNKDIKEQAVSRGFASDGEDARRISGVIDDAGSYLSGVATQQAQDESSRAQHVEDRNFSAGTAMKQSNLSLLPSLLALMRRY